MEAYCSECGMAHEVGESQKDAYMFCLGCDKFFKVEEGETPKNEDDVDDTLEQSVRYIEEQEKIVPCLLQKTRSRKTKHNLKEKIKTALKKFYAIKEKSAKPELEADPPKMNEETIAAATKSFTLIDDFLDPESDFENEPEDVPAEYIDFMSVGLDVSSSDFLEKHGKPDEHPPQKEQE